jgi:predicted carbohydrate-binding protein with CBM5 and CBM33 domain
VTKAEAHGTTPMLDPRPVDAPRATGVTRLFPADGELASANRDDRALSHLG